MGYTKQEIINRIREIEKIEEIYTDNSINYKGKSLDAKEKYTEIIAEELLNNSDKYNWENISIIRRQKSYKTIGHNGEINRITNRTEEIIAKKLYQDKKYIDIGEIIDYQVPLKDKSKTKAGKIDLLSYKEDINTMYIIELKNNSSEETLLRCALEIITYLKQIDQTKLKKDFEINKNALVKPAILIFKDTRPYFDLQDENVAMLIEKYGIDVFIAESEEEFKIKKY